MQENARKMGVDSLAEEIARNDRLLRYSFAWSDEELDSWNLSPWRLNVQVTLGCNHRCLSCSLRKRHPDELALVEWQAVLREGVEHLGVRAVSLTGGEPLSRPDTAEIISFIRSLGVPHVGMSSNMTLVDSRVIPGP